MGWSGRTGTGAEHVPILTGDGFLHPLYPDRVGQSRGQGRLSATIIRVVYPARDLCRGEQGLVESVRRRLLINIRRLT